MTNQNIHIICEGDSECAYVQWINQQLNRVDSDYRFILVEPPFSHKNAGQRISRNGKPKTIRKTLEHFFKQNTKEEIRIWVDRDFYKREGASLTPVLDKFSLDPDHVVWSDMNYEDFLTLHFDPCLARAWSDFCVANNHFNEPLIGRSHFPHFSSFLRKHAEIVYKKGQNDYLA